MLAGSYTRPIWISSVETLDLFSRDYYLFPNLLKTQRISSPNTVAKSVTKRHDRFTRGNTYNNTFRPLKASAITGPETLIFQSYFVKNSGAGLVDKYLNGRLEKSTAKLTGGPNMLTGRTTYHSY